MGKEAETLPEPTTVLGRGTKKNDSLIIKLLLILLSTTIQQKSESSVDAFVVILKKGEKSEKKEVRILEIWVVDVKIFLLLISTKT